MSSIPGKVIKAIELLEDRSGLLLDHAEQAERLLRAGDKALTCAGAGTRSSQDAASALASQAAALLTTSAGIGQRLASGRRSLERIKAEVGELGAGLVEAGRLADGVLAATGRVCELVERIDLVALNAAIEAVRAGDAGDAGKGFAVVASEMQTVAVDAIKAIDDLAEAARRVTLSADGAHVAFAGAQGVIAGLDKEVTAADDRCGPTWLVSKSWVRTPVPWPRPAAGSPTCWPPQRSRSRRCGRARPTSAT